MRPPQDWRRARVVVAIAAVTAAAFLFVWMAGAQERVSVWAGFAPYRFAIDNWGDGAPVWLTPLTATLVHAGWVHVFFNLLILLVCGRSAENVLGPASIALLYVVGAYAAAGGHYLMAPEATRPMIGASGAVAAVIGAYAILFWRNQMKVRSPRLAPWLNALWLLAAWIVLQLVIGVASRRVDLGVAIGAHIGGFVAGLALARPLLMFRYRKA